MSKRLIWQICGALVISMVVLTFTPVITPKGVADPFFLGMPYTLWSGILLSLILLGLTIVGSLVHPGRDHKDQ